MLPSALCLMRKAHFRAMCLHAPVWPFHDPSLSSIEDSRREIGLESVTWDRLRGCRVMLQRGHHILQRTRNQGAQRRLYRPWQAGDSSQVDVRRAQNDAAPKGLRWALWA